MTLHLTDRSITSDITPEVAYYIPDPGGGSWMLSWLPGRLLTREQALEGMRLDELLSDPLVEGEAALWAGGVSAASLGVDLTEVVVRLVARIAERDAWRAGRRGRRSRVRRCMGVVVPQRFMLRCLSVSAMVSRLSFAAATLPSLVFVVVALIVASSAVTYSPAWARTM
ncbi:hypothetical protein [Nocardia sp. NPDC004722]